MRVPRLARIGERAGDGLPSRHALPRQIHALEQVLRCGLAEPHLERVGPRAAALGRAETLALVHAAALPRKLGVRAAEQRVVGPEIHLDAPRRGVGPGAPKTKCIPHHPLRAPRLQVVELLGEARGIGGRRESLLRQRGRCRVMSVPAELGRESRHDHVGLEGANCADDVGQDAILVPELERLICVLRVAEVEGRREHLLGPVDPPRAQQLLRPDQPEGHAALAPDQVLPAVATRHREVGCAHLAAVREPGEEGCVLVVGMRRDHHRAAHNLEPVEREPDLRRVHRGARARVGGGHGGREDGDDSRQAAREAPARHATRNTVHPRTAGRERDGLVVRRRRWHGRDLPATETRGARAVHLAHAACAERGRDLEGAEAPAGGEFHAGQCTPRARPAAQGRASRASLAVTRGAAASRIQSRLAVSRGAFRRAAGRRRPRRPESRPWAAPRSR